MLAVSLLHVGMVGLAICAVLVVIAIALEALGVDD